MTAPEQRSPLLCPACETPLDWIGKECRCINGHSFDPAKEGYLNLLLSHQRKSSHPGDDNNMIQARRRFFDSGAFNPLTDLLIQSAIGNRQSAILDCGCGEGHFLGALSEKKTACENLKPPLQSGSAGGVAPPVNAEQMGRASLSERADQFFGVDVSKEAVRCAAKRYKKATWIVANAMRKLPFADQSFDCILSVLAPRNPVEFARVLKPEGLLILGVPGVNHLIELRSRLTGTAADFEEKADEAVAKCAPLFSETHRNLLSYEQTLTAAQIADLIQMTPIFWNSSPEAKERLRQLNELTVTISFALITLCINQAVR